MAAGPLGPVFLAAAGIHFAIAGLVLFSAPRRAPNLIAATLLALVGGSALARGLQLLASGDDLGNFTRALAFVPLDLEWPASFLVLGLALLYPREVFPSRRARWVLAALGAGVLALTVTVIVDKGLVYDVSTGSTRPTFVSIVLDDARFYVTMLAALALFAWAFLRRPLDSPDRSAEYLFIAFAIAPLSAFVQGLQALEPQMRALYPDAVALPRALIAVGGTIAFLALYVSVVVLARRRGHRTHALIGWGVFGACMSLIGAVPVYVPPWFVSAYGDFAYLVLRPCIIGYALLRHQLLDIDVKVKHGFASTTLAIFVAGVFIPTEELVRRLSGLTDELGLAVGVGAGLAVALVVHGRAQALARGASDRLFSRVREDDASYLARRRREIYRSVLERAIDSRPEDLTPLRASLGVTQDEHDAIVDEMRTAGLAVEGAGVLAGRYKILSELGQGASGVTYRCEDTLLHREVAVKEIQVGGAPSRSKKRALDEARRLAAIRHPHVVTLLDVHEGRGGTFLIMELMSGGSLAARMARERVSPEDSRAILVEILEGLAALHDAGIVHRDVKPSNVLIDASGRVKVADLGVASATAAETMTGLGPRGTLMYMAPEQVLDLPVDERADLYAAAAILYEMLAGEPYARASMRRGALLEEAIVSTPPALPIAGAPAWANAFLAKGLAKDPAMRYRSAAEAIAALAIVPGTAPGSGPASGRPQAEASLPRRGEAAAS